MRILLASVVLISTALPGCASRPPQAQDLAPHQAPWLDGRRTVADGEKLRIIFRHDNQGRRIKRIDYKVAGGELYLWPIRGSEPFEPAEFTLDTRRMNLRQPWQQNVYWVGTAHWDGVLGRLVDPDPLGDRVERVRAEVEDDVHGG